MKKKPEVKKSSYSPSSRPVWSGDITEIERKQINKLPVEDRLAALLKAAVKYKPAPALKPSPKKVAKKTAVKVNAKKIVSAKKTQKSPAVKVAPLPAITSAEQTELFPSS